MNINNIIVFVLILLPIHWVITDIIEGKIKNYFVFPSIIFLVFLSFFIEWFYFNKDNIAYIIIILLFSYFFYKWNKWWAWDGKYFILVWFSSIIIWFIKWYYILTLRFLIYTFLIFLIYSFIFLILNYKKIKEIKFQKFKISPLDFIYSIFLLFTLSFLLSFFLPNTSYNFLIIFIFMYLFISKLRQVIKQKYLKYFIILLWITLLLYKQIYFSFFMIFIMYALFNFLNDIFDQIFDIIDIKSINILEIKQWSILTEESIDKIKKEAKIELEQSPLQWLEIFEIIEFYKNKKWGDIITIYKDIRIGIFFYIWFLFALLEFFIKR